MSNGVSSSFFGQGWQFLNRVHLGQIDQIDTVQGTCSVVIFDGLNTIRDNVELPRLGFSMNGFRSSWIRYMPQLSTQLSATEGSGGDMVYVAFGPHNEARIIGFATDEGVYSEFAEERAVNPANVPAEFGELRMGEWDMRSSGGAYIYGNRSGQLLLAAGPTAQIRLDKSNNEIRTESGLWKIGGGGSFIKIGDVKRTILPTDFKETAVDSVGPAPLDPTAFKEYFLHLENFLPIPTAIMDLQMGAVRDELGLLVPSLTGGSPLRHRHRIYVPEQPSASPELINVFANEIDAEGNQRIEQLTATINLKTAPAATDTEEVLNKNITASGEFSATAGAAASITAGGEASLTAGAAALVTGGVLAQIDAPIISLGLAAVAALNPAVHGTVLLAEILSPLIAALTSLADAKNPPPTFSKDTDWVPLQTALTAITAALAIPPGTPASLLSEKAFVE